ncbi:MAG: TetR/AcrR family transcriptional regulator [bacterium]
MAGKSQTREELISAAQRLFATKSYVAVSVDNICKTAGVNKGSFYYFFASKRELLLAVLDENWEMLKRMMYTPAFETGLSPVQSIEQFFKLLFEGSMEAKQELGQTIACPVGTIGAELGNHDEVVRQRVEEIFGQVHQYFEKALEAGQASGEVDARVSPKAMADMLVTYSQGMLLMSQTKNDPHVIRVLSEGALRVLRSTSAIEK